MKAKKQLTLFLSVLLLLSVLFALAAMTVSAEETETDTLTTPYGQIGAEFESADSYPFAIFHRALGASNYTFVTALDNAFADSTVSKYWARTGDVVIYMRRSFTATTRFTNLWQTQANSITFDLGGKVLTANTASQTYYVNAIAPKFEGVTEFNLTFKNGSIASGDKAFMLIGGNAASTENNVYNVTFDGINFSANTTTNAHPFVEFTNTTTPYNCNINYSNCEFDLTGTIRPSSFRIFTSGDGTGKITSKVTVTGGVITTTASNYSAIVPTYISNNLSSVVFKPSESGYLCVKLPTGSTAPTWSLKSDKGEALGFALDSTADGYDCHSLVSLATPYGNVNAAHASSVNYPFAIFKRIGDTYTYVTATDNIFKDSYVTTYRDIAADELIFFMRRDVDNSAAGHFSNICQVKSAITYDFGGHSFTGNSSTNYGTFFLSGKTLRHSDAARKITFKNGEIITTSKTFLMVGSNGTGGDGLDYSVTFDGIIFTRATGATATDPFVQFGGGTTSGYHIDIDYDDCKFNIGGSFPGGFRLFFTGTSTNKITSTVTVNGSEIVAESMPTLTFINGTESTVNFAPSKDTGEYLRITLPSSASTPTNTVSTAGGGELKFREVSATASKKTYMLCPTVVANYLPKSSVSLYTDLVLNVYLPVDDLVSFGLDGESFTDLSVYNVVEKNGVNCYHVPVRLSVTEAAKQITLSTTLRVDSATTHTSTRVIGVVEYASLLLASSPTAAESAVINSMLAYVRQAYAYGASVLDADEVARATAAINAIIGETVPTVEISSESAPVTEGLYSARLLLGDAPAFVFYPDTDTDGNLIHSAESYVFSIDGNRVASEIMTDSEDRVCIRVATYAYAMTGTVTYTVSGSDISGSYTLADYYESDTVQNDASLKALVECLWSYSVDAEAYRAECAAQ